MREAAEGEEISPRVAIVGTGGIGKTSLAIAIARDPGIQTDFPEGILWITLGPQPKLILRQLDLLSLVTDETFLFRDVEQGRIRLERLLAGRKILLILDDVWDQEHLRAFQIASSQICILVTTRKRSIARSSQAKTHYLNSLRSPEAIALLEQYYPEEEIPADLGQKVVNYTGRHPLPIAMIGTRLTGESTQRWEAVANSLNRGRIFRLIQTESLFNYQHSCLESIQISIEQLSPEIRSFYESLVIFPESAQIPELTLIRYGQAARCRGCYLSIR